MEKSLDNDCPLIGKDLLINILKKPTCVLLYTNIYNNSPGQNYIMFLKMYLF